MFDIRRVSTIALPLLALTALAYVGSAEAQQTGNINLQGGRAINCTITVTANATASDLPFATGTQAPTVGTVTQNCNKMIGYKLWVSSANCLAGSGARLMGSVATPESQRYTVGFTNPTTGGSSNTSGLLATTCPTSAVDGESTARSVAGAKINNETSTVAIAYTVAGDLGADAYADVLTITMAVN